MIRHLRNKDIDREAWDRCISGSSFETIYPYSWYLDLVSPDWEALVEGEYNMAMPLTGTRKFGFNLLLQPILAQQLGVFSGYPLGRDQLIQFLEAVPSIYRYWDICLNINNMDLPRGIKTYNRANYELDLRDTVTTYNTNTRRNLEKGRTYSFEFRDASVPGYLDLMFAREKDSGVKREYLENLFEGLIELGRASVYGLFLEEELQAAAVLGFAETRVIYLSGSSSESGMEKRAMFVLMDSLIRIARDRAHTFDFEGSEIPGVARFFDGFGGIRTIYPRIVRAKFPFFRFRP